MRQRAIRYFGRSCQRHPELRGERHTANATCIGCQAEYQAHRKATAPEANRQATAKWQATARRARQLNATPRWLTEADYRSFDGQYAMAALMTELVGAPYHVDHIAPLKSEAVCGLHAPWNTRVIRGAENLSKGNRLVTT